MTIDFDEMIARAEIWADEQLAKNPQIKEIMEEDNAKISRLQHGQQNQTASDPAAGPTTQVGT